MAELLLLAAPGCDVGCITCVRSCAIAQIQLAWWAREEERLLRDRRPECPDWQAERREAQEHLERLRRDIRAACPPSAADQATRRGLPSLRLVHSEPGPIAPELREQRIPG